MSKYIIKNCPCYFKTLSGNYYCDCNAGGCQDYTDCLLKQIADYCLDQNLKCDTTACDILDMLDIQEIK